VSRQGIAEYQALAKAMWSADPACLNDPRYIAEPDELDDSALADMRRLCRSCPLAEYCIAYAQTAKPRAGMWAGNYYPARRRKDSA